MGKHVVFDDKGKMPSDVAKAAGVLQVLTMPTGLDFQVEIEMPPELEKAMGKDPLLMQKMQDAVKVVYTELVKDLGKSFASFEVAGRLKRDLVDPEGLKSLLEKIKKSVDEELNYAKDEANKAALACYNKYLESRAEYKKYKIQIATKVVGGVIGLTAGIATTSTAPFTGGLSGAVAIIGIIKSGITIFTEIGSALLEVETAFKLLEKQIVILEKAFVTAKGKVTTLGKANEAAGIVLKQFLGISGPTIKQASEQVEVVKSKTQGIDLKSHALAQTLNKVIKQSEAFETELLSQAYLSLDAKGVSEEAISKHVGKIKERLHKSVTPLNQKLMDLIGEIGKLQRRVKNMEAAIKPVETKVKGLEEQQGKGFEVFEFVLSFSDIVLVPVTAGVSGDWANVGRDLAIAVGQWDYDKVTELALEGTPLKRK
ncbi:hypothetical protein [Limnoglobus roseus]|uniref:hypothetical protein n=1 Tax=Limnoglobus roseus TaxID=2598579 RepID=UPI0011EABDA5|nr:hypothetical protein [Limnoglobus roseus]